MEHRCDDGLHEICSIETGRAVDGNAVGLQIPLDTENLAKRLTEDPSEILKRWDAYNGSKNEWVIQTAQSSSEYLKTLLIEANFPSFSWKEIRNSFVDILRRVIK